MVAAADSPLAAAIPSKPHFGSSNSQQATPWQQRRDQQWQLRHHQSAHGSSGRPSRCCRSCYVIRPQSTRWVNGSSSRGRSGNRVISYRVVRPYVWAAALCLLPFLLLGQGAVVFQPRLH